MMLFKNIIRRRRRPLVYPWMNAKIMRRNFALADVTKKASLIGFWRITSPKPNAIGVWQRRVNIATTGLPVRCSIYQRVILIAFILSILILLCSSVLLADVIRLKNKGIVEGKIIEETDEFVRIKIRMGEVTIKKDLISSIEEKEISVDFFHPPEKKIKDIQIKTHSKETAKRDDKEIISIVKDIEKLDESTGYILSVKAEHEKGKDIDVIIFNGKTNLPEKTVLYLFLKSIGDSIISSTKSVTSHNSFSGKIYPINIKELPQGRYTLEVVFYPSKQEDVDVRRLLGLRGEKIDNVTEGELIYDKEKDKKIIKAEYQLIIGNPEEFERERTQRKKQLSWYVDRLDTLYMELVEKYQIFYGQGKNKFQKGKWIKWSKNWKPQIERIQTKIIEDFSQDATFEFSDVPMNLEITCRLLLQLHNVYFADLSGEDVEPAYPYATTTDPDQLKKAVDTQLRHARGALENL